MFEHQLIAVVILCSSINLTQVCAPTWRRYMPTPTSIASSVVVGLLSLYLGSRGNSAPPAAVYNCNCNRGEAADSAAGTAAQRPLVDPAERGWSTSYLVAGVAGGAAIGFAAGCLAVGGCLGAIGPLAIRHWSRSPSAPALGA